MSRVEHWPEYGTLAVQFAEPPEGSKTYAREVEPGIIFSFAKLGEQEMLIAMEIESDPDAGRDLHEVHFDLKPRRAGSAA